jgi:predicted transcriptional regulator
VPSRKAVHGCVAENAGAHLRDVARRCGLPLGTALYHLDCLERAGLLVARRDGRYKRYFPASGIGRREKEVLCLLRHDAPRRIARALLAGEPLTQRGICALVGVSRSTVSFHLNRLLAEGVAERQEARPERRYALREPELVRDLLARYAESLAASPTLAAPAPALPAPLAGPEPLAVV